MSRLTTTATARKTTPATASPAWSMLKLWIGGTKSQSPSRKPTTAPIRAGTTPPTAATATAPSRSKGSAPVSWIVSRRGTSARARSGIPATASIQGHHPPARERRQAAADGEAWQRRRFAVVGAVGGRRRDDVDVDPGGADDLVDHRTVEQLGHPRPAGGAEHQLGGVLGAGKVDERLGD